MAVQGGRRGRPVFFESLEGRQLLAGTVASRASGTTIAATGIDASDAIATGVLGGVADVGSTGAAGSLAYADGTYSVSGSGAGIGGAADGFTFASSPVVQDVVVSARVASISSTMAAAGSGVMIRNGGSAVAGAPMAALLLTSGSQLTFVYRTTLNGTAVSEAVPGAGAPQFVRLTRAGFDVSPAYSSDGVAWISLGAPVRVTFDSGASRVGLAVAAGSIDPTNVSTFDHVAVIGGGSAWSQNDVGAAPSPGSGGYDSITGTYELLARGSGLADVADSIDFVAQQLAGDGGVSARIAPTSASDAIAGVVIRADASPSAPFAALSKSGGTMTFAWRVSPGDSIHQVSAAIGSAPIAVRVLRSGDRFQGFYSADGGATWQRVGNANSVAIPMSSNARAGLFVASSTGSFTAADFTGVSVGPLAAPGAGVLTGDDELFLNDLEFRTSLWFTNTQNATSGLFPDRANAYPGWLGGDSSIASTGFGLSALVIAASRGWITDGYSRALRTLTFLLNDADMNNPANHGFYYHFVNQTTGQRSGTTELSSIDTALLISGVLSAGEYWRGTALETLANQVYNRVDWTFMQPSGTGTRLRMAWTPEAGFSSATWDSWSEGPLLYLLAMGSPTHAISAGSWLSFARDTNTSTYAGQTIYDAAGAPLFTNQYPQAWFDLRAKSDIADADRTAKVVHLDPYQNSKTHTLLQRQASIDAAASGDARYAHFGPNTWGLTASDSPTGYKVSGGPPINSDGTIVPTAPGGSLAFTPRQSIDDLENLKATYPTSYRTWGFVDAFNPRPGINWYDNDALGIDQGMLLIAAENLRSGLMWQTFMRHPAAQQAVALAFVDDGTFAPPAIAASTFSFETRQAISVTFTDDVNATFDATDVQIVNLTTGQPVSPTAWSLSAGGTPTTATIVFDAPLADGRYTLQVAPNGVARSDGTTNVAMLSAPFFVLAGDANRDGAVTFSDLLVLARNYGSTGKTFSGGNFDYSSDGLVNFNDLLTLARRYGSTLAPSPAVAKPATAVNSSDHRRRTTAAYLLG